MAFTEVNVEICSYITINLTKSKHFNYTYKHLFSFTLLLLGSLASYFFQKPIFPAGYVM